MKNVALKIVMLAMASVFLSGCGKSSNKYLDELKNYKQPPDTDVTQSPEYNFSSFSGTICKTRVKVAVIDSKTYTGKHSLGLFPPETFDPTNPKYRPIQGMRIITVLPIGTRLRIDRLMQDNGEWGGVWVAATLENGTNSQENIYVDPRLLANNEFIPKGPSSSTNWGVNPDMLEAVTNAP
ncbi:MAG TPA: hypothetical protein VHG89_02500 [Verrucomicrobiae bacterium]|nr:hypothetical protein [Verrucomicrobiae bacterium]